MIDQEQPKPGQFIQCRFARKGEDGSTTETVSWIPIKVKHRDRGGLVRVEVGMIIDLKEEDGTWTRDWTIVGTGAIQNRVPDVRKSIRTHRQRSGDDLPKTK